MATFTRQPFAPLDGARLQTLTSLKNRQNALPSASFKRKASEVDTDDFENIDPTIFSKRSKSTDDGTGFAKDFLKPSNSYLLTKASTPIIKDVTTPKFLSSSSSSSSSLASSRPRTILQPKSVRLSNLNTRIPQSSLLTAPAGRSPTRGSKRAGILSRRRTQRVDPPPAFNLGRAGAAPPFSLDAALKGTIPSYSGSSSSSDLKSSALDDDGLKSSWFFDIHEDTPEQEMTNLLQHSTCTLDISSDEESERRACRERAEGRDKENIPPADDVSQTTARARAAAGLPFDDADKMAVDKMRGPLVEMNAADYYAEGCDSLSVFIVHDDEEAETVIDTDEPLPLASSVSAPELPQPKSRVALAEESFEFSPRVQIPHEIGNINIDALMGKEESSVKAAVLEPIEGTGESFELWESQSANDPASPRDVPAEPDAAPAAVQADQEAKNGLPAVVNADPVPAVC